MASPTLSVVMPNYNHARFIPWSLQAILDQSWRPSEVIFIDDASTDNSLDVVRRYTDEHRVIKLIENEKNHGVNDNLARALEMATGDYVVGAACDDQVLPGFFEKSMDLLARHPQAALCSCRSRIMDEDGTDLGLLPGMVVSDVSSFIPPQRARRILRSFGNWMQGNTTIYRREALIEAGGFRSELHSFSDNFVSQVLALKHGACFIPEALCSWRRMRTTYSAGCTSDSEIGRQIVRNATALMQSEYRDLFPRGYARNWEREAAFEQAKTSYFVRKAPIGGGPGSARRPMAQLDRIRVGIATLYFLARHRPVLAARRRIKIVLSDLLRQPAQFQH